MVLYLPFALDQFGKHLSYVALFSGNISFYNSVGDYWAPISEQNPLLHMWSLAVEEQFYFIFPLILIIVIRLIPKMLAIILIALFLVSLGLNLYLTYYGDAEFAFFMLPTRTWELVLGALVFLALRSERITTSDTTLSLLAYLGFGLILCGLFLIDQSMLFPGFSAMLPVFGTALVIFAASPARDAVGKLLQFTPVRFIGLISYSLYLWHWPIIVLYKESTGHNTFSITEISALFLASFAAAVLSWHFVEKPFRAHSKQKLLPFAFAIGSVIFLYGSAGVFRITDGLPQRYIFIPDQTARNILLSDVPDRNGSNRFQTFNLFKTGGRLELFGETAPQMMIIGDSHGAMLAPVLYDLAREYQYPISFITHDGKKPLLSDETNLNDIIYSHLENWQPNVTFLIYRWDNIWRKGDLEELALIEQKIRLVAGESKRVVVVLQVPRILQDNARIAKKLYRAYRESGDTMPVIGNDNAIKISNKTRSFIEGLDLDNLTIFDPIEILSYEGEIIYHEEGKLYYRDDDHLNRFGSMKLRDHLELIFKTH